MIQLSCSKCSQEQIMSAYDKIIAEGCRQPMKALQDMNLPGFFRSCVYDCKWGALRVSQRWTLLCSTAPKIMSKCRELPNSLRKMINYSKLKYGEVQTDKRCALPVVLSQVVEKIVMDRVLLGEEVSMVYVKHAILHCCDVWNECVDSMKSMLEVHALETLRSLDDVEMTEDELEATFKDIMAKADEILKPVHVTGTDAAVLYLGERTVSFCKPR